MKHKWKIFLAAAIMSLAAVGPAMAQVSAPGFDLLIRMNQLRRPKADTGNQPPGPLQIYLHAHPKESADLHAFVSAHPAVIKRIKPQLNKKPSVLLDPAWRNREPALNDFIRHHPGLWKALLAAAAQHWTPEFAHFLKHNPRLESAIRANPELLYQRAWVAKRPKLAEFMKTHTSVWDIDPAPPATPKNKPPPANKKLMG